MTEVLVTLAIIVALVVLNGLFVAAEFAIVGAPRARIEHLAAQGSILAQRVRKVLEQPRRQDRYIATTQIGISVASLGLGMYGEHVLAEWIAVRLEALGAGRWVAEKVARIAREIPPTEVDGDPEGGPLLVVGWGSTQGPIRGAVELARREGLPVSRLHLRYLNPLPPDLGQVLKRYDRVLVPEMNMGQLAFLLQGRYMVPVLRYNKVQGRPFMRGELLERIGELLTGGSDAN